MGMNKPITLSRWEDVRRYSDITLSRVLVIGNSPVQVYNIRYHLKNEVMEKEKLSSSSLVDYPPEGEKNVQLSKIYTHLNRGAHQQNLLIPEKKYYFLSNIVENTQEGKSAVQLLESFVQDILARSSHGFMVFHVEDPYSYSFLFAQKKNPLYSYFLKEGVVFRINLPNQLFAFTDAFLARDLSKTYRLWKALQKNKEEPRKLLIMLIRSLRFMLQYHSCKDPEQMKPLSKKYNFYAQHPFVIKKLSRFAEGFSQEELLDILFEAYQAHEYLSPSQEDKIGFDPEEIFEQFLIRSLSVQL